MARCKLGTWYGLTRATKKVAYQKFADKIVSKFGVPRLTGCAGEPLS